MLFQSAAFVFINYFTIYVLQRTSVANYCVAKLRKEDRKTYICAYVHMPTYVHVTKWHVAKGRHRENVKKRL